MLEGADRTIAWADKELIKLDNGERTLENITEKIFSSEPKQVRPTPIHDVRYIVNEFEARAMDGSKAVISGYASIFDRSSQVLGGGFVEQIKRGAFTKLFKKEEHHLQEMTSKLFSITQLILFLDLKELEH